MIRDLQGMRNILFLLQVTSFLSYHVQDLLFCGRQQNQEYRKPEDLHRLLQQHQQLFCIVERAYQLVKSNDVITCYDELLSIIHELTDYTVTHFADEEAYMEKIGYEGLAAQKNAHASFVARLESINLIELDENPQKYMESLIEFLLGWLINHILYSDKKIPVQA